MEESPLNKQLESPKDIWHRSIIVNPGKLLGAVARGAGYVGVALLSQHFDQKPPSDIWVKAFAEGINALEAFSLNEDTPLQRAWLLIHHALLRASLQVIRESVGIILRTREGIFRNSLDAGINELMQDETITLCPDFFQRPRNLPLLTEYQRAFNSWLVANGIEKQTSSVIAHRLPSYYVYELHREWSEHADRYLVVREALETPFTEAAQHEYEWQRYVAWLQKQVAEPIFDEPFSLEQLFIGPRASGVKLSQEARLTDEPYEHEKGFEVIDLMDYLDRWRQGHHQHEAILTLCGGPGSGKSSVAKIFAARSAANGAYPLYIPLHRFDPSGPVIASVGEYLQQQTTTFSFNPLDGRERADGLILIFDGLDELAAQGRIAREVAADFIRAVENLVNNRNQEKVTLRVLFCGRDVVVQENSITLQRVGKVITLLPYTPVVASKYHGNDLILKQDQRDSWWTVYGKLTSAGYTKLPDELRRDDLDDITAQPLLNYLLATTYCRGKLDITGTINMNTIYATLLKHIYQRDYAGQIHQAVRIIDSDKTFTQILEEIALAIWHGNGRTAAEQDICDRLSESKRQLLASIRIEAETCVSQMMLAFYFQQSGHFQSHPTFEFTHRSFGEYLVARRIVYALREIEVNMQSHGEFSPVWGEKEALAYWARICGPTPLDRYVVTFLRGEVALHIEKLVSWQGMLIRLINHLLRYGIPMEMLNLPTFHLANRQARNAEEALLVAVNACALLTKQTTNIDWPQSTSAGGWLMRLKGQRENWNRDSLTLDSLSWLNMAGQCLIGVELSAANLIGVNLEGTDLIMANLARANLTEAYLAMVKLNGARLTSTNFTKAKLNGANLTMADLNSGDLTNADLTGAMLKDTSLNNAKFFNTRISNARFDADRLKQAIIENTDFSEILFFNQDEDSSDDI